MSYENTLDNPDDNLSTQPLGVEYLDFCLNKSKLNSDKSTQENSHLNMENLPTNQIKKKKHRRSMLGKRTNIQHTVDEFDKETTLLRSHVPYKSEEPPANPFLCEEEASGFFENEINNLGPWSVFKTKSRHEGIKSPNSKKEEKTERQISKPFSKPPPPRKSLKKLFDEHSIMKGYSNILKEEKYPLKIKENSTDLHGEHYYKKEKAIFPTSQPSSTKSSDEEEVFYDTESNDKNIKKNGNEVVRCVPLITITSDTVENDSSHRLPSSIETENSSSKSNKSPKLSVISEEDIAVSKCIKNPESQTLPADDDDDDSTPECDVKSNKYGVDHLTKLCFTVQKHSDNIDKILLQLSIEKKQYNLHSKALLREINQFQKKYKNKNMKL